MKAADNVRRLQDLAVAAKVSPVTAPTFEPWGMGYRATWAPNARLEVQGLRESRSDGIHAEVQAFWGDTRIEWDMGLNLGSVRTRDAFAKVLAEKFPDFDWRGAIRQLAEMAIDAHRKGKPLEQLDDAPAQVNTPWLLRPLLPQGLTTLLYGDGEVGKSWLALYFAVCAAEGISPSVDIQQSAPCKVLYLDWECDRETHARRVRQLCMERNSTPRIFYREMHRPLVKDIERVQEICSAESIDLVVVDSLGWAVGGNMNEPEPAIACMTALRDLPGTKLALTHVSHAGAESRNGVGGAFGSRYFRHGCRMAWEIKRNENNLGLYCRKSNVSRRPQPIGLAFEEIQEGGPVRYYSAPIQNDAELSGHLPIHESIAASLRRGGPTLSVKEIAEDIEETDAKVRTVLNRHKMLFTKDGNVWRLRNA